MPFETLRRGSRSARDWIVLICGALLFISPWVLGFAGVALPAYSAWIGGIVIVWMAVAALFRFAEWEEWVALVVGVLMIMAPWVLGFAAITYAVWTYVVLGLIVAAASVSEVWMIHHPAPAAR